MIDLTIAEIAGAVGGDVRHGAEDLAVRSVTTDSRSVGREALFVALRGEHADGHDHVADAAANGAVALLVERAIEPPPSTAVVTVDDTWRAIAALGAAVRDRVDPTVVAITGSVGKTTTKDLTAAALGAGLRTVAARGSYNNELGVPLTLLEIAADTEAAVVEIGARGIGHIAALTPIVRPDIAIVTAVAGVHLELFGDVDAVAVAKGELVEALDHDGTAVLNADDPRVAAMAGRTPAHTLRYGVDGHEHAAEPDVIATGVTLDRVARASFRARTPWGDVDVRLPVAGAHQVGNALAALTAAGAVGVPIEAAAAAIEAARVSAWRGEVHEAGDVVILNDAYNANPTSVLAALEMLRAVERTGRTWAVLGVMAEIGQEHDAEHERVGRAAADLGIDRVVVVGQPAHGIVAGMGAAGAGARCEHVGDAAAALAAIRDEVSAGDVVLVKASRVGGLEQVANGLLAHLDGSGAAP